MNKPPKLGIIGPGKVGLALGTLAVKVGYELSAVGGRSLERTNAVVHEFGLETLIVPVHEVAAHAEMLLLTVTDDAIESLVYELVKKRVFREGTIVVHCSGALTSEILEVVKKDCRCHVASFHPLQTFPTVQAALESLPGTFCFLEGDEAALEVLQTFAVQIGTTPMQIPTGKKVLYHAAAVVACNYLAVLMDISLELGELAGIKRSTFWTALLPMITATFENITRLDTLQALTGPIARQDASTVQEHLQKLGELPSSNLLDSYKALGRRALEMTACENKINLTSYQTLQKLLK